jgi:hypothetical protein
MPEIDRKAHGPDLTKVYDKHDYAIYLPSLQSPYASFATKHESEVREGNLPSDFRMKDLDFFNQNSRLWSCGYALYSAGQFTDSQLRSDIVAYRDRSKSVVIGDSGGFQLGTGKISNVSEKAALVRYANDPAQQVANWHATGFRERTLEFLDLYCDYSMTLDMPLWAQNKNGSQLRNLEVEQLIQLSVENLRFFNDNRGRNRGKGTKFLSVLQDNGNGAGLRWYDAVKGFEFEGWAFAGDIARLPQTMTWLRKLLDENKLDKTEWVHVLQNSPPIMTALYTAVQRSLSKAAGHKITLSCDSSSPHQAAGKNRALYRRPSYTNKLSSWRMSLDAIPQNIQVARGRAKVPMPVESPLAKFFTINDLVYHDDPYQHSFVDPLSEHLIVNHNIYTFHTTAQASCDLIFDEKNRDFSLVPKAIQEFIGFAESYFTTDKPDELHQQFEPIMKKLCRKKDPNPNRKRKS